MLASMRALCACLLPAADAPCAKSKDKTGQSESTCCGSPAAGPESAHISQRRCHEDICESHGARLEVAASANRTQSKDDVYSASPFYSARVPDTLDAHKLILSACNTVTEEVSGQQYRTMRSPGTELASTATTPLANCNRWANDYHEGHLLPAQLNVDTSSLQHLLETGTLQGLHRRSCSTTSMHPHSAEHAKFPAHRAQGTPTKSHAASSPLLADPCTRPLASAAAAAGQPDPDHGNLYAHQLTHNHHLSDCDSCHSTGITSGTGNCSGHGPDSGGILREQLVRLCAPGELIGDLSDLTPAALGTRSAVFSALWRGARVAVKFTTCTSLDPESSAIRQALLSKALSHPNVLQHYSVRCCHLAPADSPDTPPPLPQPRQQLQQQHPDEASEAATRAPLPRQEHSCQLAASLGCGGDGAALQPEVDGPPLGDIHRLPDGLVQAAGAAKADTDEGAALSELQIEVSLSMPAQHTVHPLQGCASTQQPGPARSPQEATCAPLAPESSITLAPRAQAPVDTAAAGGVTLAACSVVTAGAPAPQTRTESTVSTASGWVVHCTASATPTCQHARHKPPASFEQGPSGELQLQPTLVPVFHVVRDRCSNATATSAADATPGTISPLGTLQDTDTAMTSHELGVAKGWELALSATAESTSACLTGEAMAQLPIAAVSSTYHLVDVQDVKGLQACGRRQGQGQGHDQVASHPSGAISEMDTGCFTLVANAVAVGTEEDGEQGGGALVGDLVMVRCASTASGASPLEVAAVAARNGRVPQPHLQHLLASAAPSRMVRQGQLTGNEQGNARPMSGARDPAACASAVPSVASAFTTAADTCPTAKAAADASPPAAGAASPPAVSFNSFEGFGNPYGTSTMRHTLDHVAVVVAAREDDFMTAIIMEHADKGTLGAVVGKGLFRGNRVLSPRVALRALLRTALEIGCGLNHLHGRSIVHGALRPANVLLKSANLDRRGFTAKVANFSLARVCGGTSCCEAVGDLQGLEGLEEGPGGGGGGSSLPPGEVALALPYWSPEQLDGHVGKPSDVYAFGVTLYVMATGLLPYSGLAPATIVSGVREGSLRPQWPPGPASETTHPAVRELCGACWAHDPRARPTFTQVCQQLQGIEHAVRQLLRPPPQAVHGGPSAGASNLSRCSWATQDGVPGGPGPHAVAQDAGGAGVVAKDTRG